LDEQLKEFQLQTILKEENNVSQMTIKEKENSHSKDQEEQLIDKKDNNSDIYVGQFKAKNRKKKFQESVKNLIFCSFLSVLSLYPLLISTYELENIGLSNIELTSTIMTIGDLTSNIVFILILDKIPRKRGLIYINVFLFFFSFVLFITNLVWSNSGQKIFNTVIAFFAKGLIVSNFILTLMFTGKASHVL
jgi:hypothetical protein